MVQRRTGEGKEGEKQDCGRRSEDGPHSASPGGASNFVPRPACLLRRELLAPISPGSKMASSNCRVLFWSINSSTLPFPTPNLFGPPSSKCLIMAPCLIISSPPYLHLLILSPSFPGTDLYLLPVDPPSTQPTLLPGGFSWSLTRLALLHTQEGRQHAPLGLALHPLKSFASSEEPKRSILPVSAFSETASPFNTDLPC